MLYDARRRAYVRLSPNAARLLPLLDGTRTAEEIVDELARRHAVARERVARPVGRFLDDIRQAELLNAAPTPVEGRERAVAVARELPIRRFRLTGPVDRWLEPPARLVRRLPPRAAGLLVAALLTAAVTLAILAVAALAGGAAPHIGGWWPLIVAVLGVELVAHEAAHAFACQVLGVPIRESGVALWFGVLPIAYVDHTDAYRVRRRRGRVAIALAGPASDLLFAGASAAVALTAAGGLAGAAQLLLMLQLSMTVANLDPLLPTDGYRALEALAGEVNLRARAFGYLSARALRVELTSAFARVTAARARAYAGYALASGAYTLFLLAGLGLAIVRLAA
jgi:putative peptide zinc metalloprotease protein